MTERNGEDRRQQYLASGEPLMVQSSRALPLPRFLPSVTLPGPGARTPWPSLFLLMFRVSEFSVPKTAMPVPPLALQ